MSQDQAQRTHKPTPKRIREFRKRGDVAISKEITTAATMLGGALGCAVVASTWTDAVKAFIDNSSRSGIDYDLSLLVAEGVRVFSIVFVPVVAGGFLGYTVAAAAQLGWPPSFKTPKLDFAKPFALSSIANILSPKAAAVRAFQSTAKVALVLLVLLLAIRGQLDAFMLSPSVEADGVLRRIGLAVAQLGIYAAVVFGVMAAFDFLLQKRRLMAKMRMTTEEIKREHKEQDGDPIIRGQRRKRMRTLAKRRLAEVKSADVVLVNPTHYAVALRYRSETEQAPKVVAKGRGTLAENIRMIARKAGVPILSRPPLTRLLYRLVPEGSTIPSEVYKAVAEVLAYIYRLRGRTL